MNHAKIATMSLGAALALATSAAAAQPAECTTPAAKQTYEAAKKMRERFLEQLFETSFGCRGFEKFAKKVDELTAGITASDPCVVAGMRDAATSTINNLFSRCTGSTSEVEQPPFSESESETEAPLSTGECAKNGKEIGLISAAAYCEMIRGGAPEPPPPPPLCDLIAAQACRNAFMEHVRTSCATDRANPSLYNKLVESACAPPSM
ncbi:hypothetical protein [Sorangium sp. So ce406]|uniref:hypothetical protein n=1 Tax=Sorangium sp. So ce406 TaxID=3133311 RepID=UPI003F5B6091